MAGRAELTARDLALVAVFAGLIAALGLPGTVLLFGGAVTITAQSLGPMLAGSILGARRGALAVLVLLALVAAGLPLLAGGRGGLGVFAGPSAGYLLGWIGGAWVVGWITEKALSRRSAGPGSPGGPHSPGGLNSPGGPHSPVRPRYSIPWGLLANLAGGILAVYAVGIPLQAWRIDSGLAAAVLAAGIYLPGDLVKAVIATSVAKGVHLGYPTLQRDLEGKAR